MPGYPREWLSHSKDGLWSVAQASDRLRPTGDLAGRAPMKDDIGNLSQVRRDLAEIRHERRAERRDYWLRCVGYVTRLVVYFGPVVLSIWLLWPHADGLSQASSLGLIDLLLIGGCVVGFFGAVIPLVLFFFNVDGDSIDWEDWGRVGLGLLPVAALGVLWLGSLP